MRSAFVGLFGDSLPGESSGERVYPIKCAYFLLLEGDCRRWVARNRLLESCSSMEKTTNKMCIGRKRRNNVSVIAVSVKIVF